MEAVKRESSTGREKRARRDEKPTSENLRIANGVYRKISRRGFREVSEILSEDVSITGWLQYDFEREYERCKGFEDEMKS